MATRASRPRRLVPTVSSVEGVRRVKVFPLGTPPNDVDRFRVQLHVGRRLG